LSRVISFARPARSALLISGPAHCIQRALGSHHRAESDSPTPAFKFDTIQQAASEPRATFGLGLFFRIKTRSLDRAGPAETMSASAACMCCVCITKAIITTSIFAATYSSIYFIKCQPPTIFNITSGFCAGDYRVRMCGEDGIDIQHKTEKYIDRLSSIAENHAIRCTQEDCNIYGLKVNALENRYILKISNMCMY
jgi:hypothetical protein